MLKNPHRRFNPLTGKWILVSPQRTQRPWQGKNDNPVKKENQSYDPNCYLCPGNLRANGNKNPIYYSTYVFTNDFTALIPESKIYYDDSEELFLHEGIKGTCKVICFSPNHNLTFPELKLEEIQEVVNVWCDQNEELGKEYQWVQIFENKGEIMGCSNPHPHGQIWASTSLPNEIISEDNCQREYYKRKNSILLKDYLDKEIVKKERIVLENNDWVVLVPYWAVWPYETMLLPKMFIKRINDLNYNQRISLSEILKKFLTVYDKLFNIQFPYTMGWHGAPFNNDENNHWWLHAHFYPPLLRSATVKKFMVGYEMLAEAQRDITPESAAEQLRTLI